MANVATVCRGAACPTGLFMSTPFLPFSPSALPPLLAFPRSFCGSPIGMQETQACLGPDMLAGVLALSIP